MGGVGAAGQQTSCMANTSNAGHCAEKFSTEFFDTRHAMGTVDFAIVYHFVPPQLDLSWGSHGLQKAKLLASVCHTLFNRVGSDLVRR